MLFYSSSGLRLWQPKMDVTPQFWAALLDFDWNERSIQKRNPRWSHWTHRTISSSFSSSDSDTPSLSPLFLHSHLHFTPWSSLGWFPSFHALLSLPLLFFSSKMYTSYIPSVCSFLLLSIFEIVWCCDHCLANQNANQTVSIACWVSMIQIQNGGYLIAYKLSSLTHSRTIHQSETLALVSNWATVHGRIEV